jgi:protocatechuate 3,4-dioxygenase beta subunit
MLRRSHVLAATLAITLGSTPLAMRMAPRGQSADGAITVQGRVVTDGEMPLNRARVEALSDAPSTEPAEAYSSRDGRFSLSMRPPLLRLRISKAGFAPQTIQLEDLFGGAPRSRSATRLTITLARGAAVTGSVIDDLGDPVVGARVTVKYVDPGARPPGAEMLSTDTDDRGEFRIGSLRAGEVEVTTTEVPVHGRRMDPATGQRRSDAEVTVSAVPVRARLNAGADAFVPLRATVRSSLTGQESSRNAEPGMAAIAGRISMSDGRPLRRAFVEVMRSTGESVGITQTDAQGRYEIAGITGGAFRLSVRKQGFPEVQYGQTRARQSGTLLSVREGQRLQNVDVTLGRGSVMTGRLVDAEGEPVEGVVMDVFEVSKCGETTAVSAADVEDMVRTTDDRGEYRLYGLLPATYFVTALPRGRDGTSSATEPDGVPVYYPGTSSAASALSVPIKSGDELRLADTIFSSEPGARISGRAFDSGGRPLEGSAVLVVSERSGAPYDQPRIAAISNGEFEFSKVPPGDYTLQAVAGALFGGGGEFGVQLVGITGAERLSPTVTTSAGSNLSGRIVLDGDASGLRPADFDIGLSSTDNDRSPIIGESLPQTHIKDDWTFLFTHVTGVFRIIPTRVPEGWWLKSALMDGSDAAEEGVVFGTREASRSDVEVVFSRGAAGVEGRTLDARKMPVRNASVAVFTTDAARWRTLPRRYTRLVRSDQDGRFTAGGLPPGEYFAAAFDDADIAPRCIGTASTDLLNTLARSARRLRLRAGARLSQDLEVR